MKRYFVIVLSVIALTLILSSCFIVQKPTIEAPILLLPANNTITSTNVTLIWKAPNVSQPLEYKVFFGTNPNPSYVTTTQSTSFNENELKPSTNYYWKIAAVNQSNQVATSAVWSFTITASSYSLLSTIPLLGSPWDARVILQVI